MASFRIKLNLLAFAGSKCVTMDENGKKVNYVMVPMDLNEIKVEMPRDKSDVMRAVTWLSMWPYNESYRNSVRQGKERRGDPSDESKIPTHKIEMSHSEEFVKAWAGVRAMVDKVVADDNGQTPGLAQQNPLDPKSDLYLAIRNRINKRVAQCYAIPPKTQQQQAPAQFGTPEYGAPAQPFDPSQYAQQQGYDPSSFTNPQNDDDLPF